MRFLFSMVLVLTAIMGATQTHFSISYDNSGNIIERKISVTMQQRIRLDSEKDSTIAEVKKHLQIFPNPTSDQITVSGTLPDEVEDLSLIVFNSSGQTLYADIYSGTEKSIDVSALVPGMYLLECVVRDESKVVYKIIVTN